MVPVLTLNKPSPNVSTGSVPLLRFHVQAIELSLVPSLHVLLPVAVEVYSDTVNGPFAPPSLLVIPPPLVHVRSAVRFVSPVSVRYVACVGAPAPGFILSQPAP